MFTVLECYALWLVTDGGNRILANLITPAQYF